MNNKKLIGQGAFLLLLIAGTFFILRNSRKESATSYQTDQGFVFGTMYKIMYQSSVSRQQEIEAELQKVDNSLSTFNKSSIISRINRNEEVVPDSMFLYVFKLAEKISVQTHGAFDITVAPLVNVWGFGFKEKQDVNAAQIDSIRTFVGYQKIALKNGEIVKDDPRTMLDCSAIAKGFGCDAVARLLDRKGIKNYMVDIGGEVVVKGENRYNTAWSIGVDKPLDDSLATKNNLQTVLYITNAGMATSGNYRNFYYKDGKKYAHTIDPLTGYPVQHSLLSATVVAPDCATADAFATSFMVLGVDSAMAVCRTHPDLEGYFIYSDDKGDIATKFSDGMEKYMHK